MSAPKPATRKNPLSLKRITKVMLETDKTARANHSKSWAGGSILSITDHRVVARGTLRPILPPAVSEVGFFNGGDDPVSSLWKPYGSLIVRKVTPKDNLTSLQARGLHYIFAVERGLRENRSQTIEEWATDLHGSIVATTILHPSVSRGPGVWALIYLP